MSDRMERVEEQRRQRAEAKSAAPAPELPGIAECEDCSALVRAERMKAHEQWHNQQQDWWHEVWTGEQR